MDFSVDLTHLVSYDYFYMIYETSTNSNVLLLDISALYESGKEATTIPCHPLYFSLLTNKLFPCIYKLYPEMYELMQILRLDRVKHNFW